MKKDKVQHFFWGLSYSIVLVCLGMSAPVSLLFILAMALTKEVLDKVSGLGTIDPYDFQFTVLGWFVLQAGILIYTELLPLLGVTIWVLQ